MINKEELLPFAKDFAANLSLYDYIGFAVGFILFILFFMIAIVVRKRIAAFLFFLFMALAVPFATPFGIKYTMNNYIKTTKISITTNKRLKFVDAILLEGNITNTGMMHYKKCQVRVKYSLKGANELKTMVNSLKPFRVEKIMVEEPIAIGGSASFKMLVENFPRESGYNDTVVAECW